MKIKDLPEDTNIGGVTFLHPETKEHVKWVSQWNRGVWVNKVGDKNPHAIYPIFVEDIEEALEWEVPA